MKKSKKKELTMKARESVQRPSFVDGNIHFLMPAILLGALLVRILAFSNFSQSLYGDFLIWDERVYQAWASHILEGKLFVVHDFSPLPAYVMAAVYRLLGNGPDHVRMVNIIFGIFTCLFIYCIGRDLANRTIGLLACLIASLYKPFIFFSITILKESLALFLFSAAIYLFISLMKESDNPPGTLGNQEEGQGKAPCMRRSGRILLLGITAGLLINVRQNCVVLLPVFPLLLLWRMRRKVFLLQKAVLTLTLFLIGLCLSLSPFLIRNYHATGEFSASPAGGFNLYLANNLDNPYPYYRPVSFATSVPAEQATQFIIEASRKAGKKLSPEEASSFWTREVIQIAREHPGALAWKLWQKTLVLFNQFEAEDNYDLGFISRFVPFFRLPFFAFWFVFPLGMAWMLLSVRKSEKNLALGVVFLIYALTLIAFFSNMRIRIPLLVILIPYAAMGLDLFFKVLKKQVPITAGYRCLIVFVLLTAIEFLPVTGIGDLTSHYNTHAINLASKGFEREAIRYWEESSGMNRPYSAYANHSLAGAALRRGDLEAGKRYLALIPDASFAAAQKHELMGEILLRQGRTDEAVAAYRRSLSVNAGQRGVYMKMIRILERTNPAEAGRVSQELAWVNSFYPAR